MAHNISVDMVKSSEEHIIFNQYLVAIFKNIKLKTCTKL
jgi:hypothetical protein